MLIKLLVVISWAVTLVAQVPTVPNEAFPAFRSDLNSSLSAAALKSVFDISAYGAISDGKVLYDAAMISNNTVTGANGSTTAPTSPSGATTFANERVLSIYAFQGAFTAPGTPTQRFYGAGSGSLDGVWLGDQLVSSAGSFSANAGTITSAPWAAAVIPLIPVSGQTIAFVASASGTGASTAPSITVNKPTGTVAGNVEVACVGYFPTSSFFFYAAPAGWASVAYAQYHTSSGTALQCWIKQVSASEPASYAFVATGAHNATAVIATYTNVSAVDNALTSATASFSSADVGKILCVAGADAGTSISNCAPINLVANSTTIYPLFGNASGVAISNGVITYATNNTPAIAAAFAAAAVAGGTVHVPIGTFGFTSITIPTTTKAINFIGEGSAISTYGAGFSTSSIQPSGSTLMALSNNAGSAAIIYPPDSTFSWLWVPTAIMRDITILGSGNSRGGTGGDGIDIYWQHLVLDRISVAMFSGDAIKISNNNGVRSSYTGELSILHSYLQFSNIGLEITGTGGGKFNQNITIANNEIDFNWSYGLEIDGAPLMASVFDNNIIQWNNASLVATYEVMITQPTPSVSFRGNWIENDIAGFGIYLNGGAGAQGPSIVENHFIVNPAIKSTGSVGTTVTGNYFGSGWLDNASTWINPTIDATNVSPYGPSKVFAGTSGTASCVVNILGGSVIGSCYLAGYANTGAAQTWIFNPTFVAAPILQESGGSCGTFNPSATSGLLTLPANAAMTAETCTVLIWGQTN